MEMMAERVDVWIASIEDRPGAISKKLAMLAEAGADLEFVIARRAADRPGNGVLYVTPLRGDAEVKVATDNGFYVSNSLHSVRVEGDNKRGVAATATRKIAEAGINVRGFSGAVIGSRYVMHVAFDTQGDANRALEVLA